MFRPYPEDEDQTDDSYPEDPEDSNPIMLDENDYLGHDD